jgi:SAM-dependent methyltransferase
MAVPSDPNEYALGSDDAEQARLIRQAAWLIAHTERLFRAAGICSGQRVLDLGSGVGDVSLIAGSIVGTEGEVLGAERDPRAVARATSRARELGLKNVRFTQVDIAALPIKEPFDAAVGRYILMFLRDPVAVLRSASKIVRPGGIIAFQEPCWQTFLQACEALPLWRACAALMLDTFHYTGVNTRMGADLTATFVAAGLPEPVLQMDTLIGAERWMPDVIQSLAPQMRAFDLPLGRLGNLSTLYERLIEEADLRRVTPPLPAIIGAWARKPES